MKILNKRATHKSVHIFTISLMLTSCMLPFNQEDEAYEIAGYVEGKKSNFDEKIIVISNTTGFTGFVGHGKDAIFDNDSTSYEYFLEKGGNRVKLDFLYRWRGNGSFDQIYNVNNQWYAVDIVQDSDEIEIYQFKYSEDLDSYDVGHDIDVHNTDAILELYISENASVIVWRDVNVGYHEYNLRSKKITRRYFNPSKSEIDALLKIPILSAKYDELSFTDAIKSVKNNNQQLQQIISSQEPDVLFGATNAKDYLVRWAVALNRETSKELLDYLANDKSYYVASAARKRLATNSFFNLDE